MKLNVDQVSIDTLIERLFKRLFLKIWLSQAYLSLKKKDRNFLREPESRVNHWRSCGHIVSKITRKDVRVSHLPNAIRDEERTKSEREKCPSAVDRVRLQNGVSIAEGWYECTFQSLVPTPVRSEGWRVRNVT